MSDLLSKSRIGVSRDAPSYIRRKLVVKIHLELMDLPLPSPVMYTPWTKGIYDVAPGLRPLGTDFGNGELDQVLFQFDNSFPKYRENKLRCKEERPAKYCLRHALRPEVEGAVIELITERLVAENPECFRRQADRLECGLTAETITPALDALALQIPEDFAIVQLEENGDRNAYLNLCSPSHWAGESKIGRSFFETHLPIPGFDRVNAVASALVDSMIKRGPYVRFVWGVESDDRLNHHPEPPPGEDPVIWHGREFEKGWFVRTERQVVWGLPNVNAALFVIRVGFVTSEFISNSPGLLNSLVSSVRSMSPEAQAYKGVDGFLASLDLA